MPGPKRNICQLCRIRWAQTRERLCRRCGRAMATQTGDSYARLPVDHRVTAHHGHLNGYPIGARCAVHLAPPLSRVVVHEPGVGARLVEITWNGT